MWGSVNLRWGLVHTHLTPTVSLLTTTLSMLKSDTSSCSLFTAQYSSGYPAMLRAGLSYSLPAGMPLSKWVSIFLLFAVCWIKSSHSLHCWNKWARRGSDKGTPTGQFPQGNSYFIQQRFWLVIVGKTQVCNNNMIADVMSEAAATTSEPCLKLVSTSSLLLGDVFMHKNKA